MKSHVAIALVAVSLMAIPAHAAGSYTDAYTAPSTWPVGVSCTPDCLGTAGTGLPVVNLGGVNFAPDGSTPATVVVQDASGGDVSFQVCQDLNGDGFCGDSGTLGLPEPSVVVCGTVADLSASAVPFDPTLQTSVFVTAATPDCPGPATTGTVTLTTV